MTYTTLISAPELRAWAASGAPLMVFDCSFDMTHPDAAAGHYLQAHIPGAIHVDLDRNLSALHGAPGAHGTIIATQADIPASGGRHPLPSREKFATWLRSVGFTNAMQAVVYDRNGSAFCGRLWWMLQWVGHSHVAVLDGGWQGWLGDGGAVAQGKEASHFASDFALRAPLNRLASVQEVEAALGQPGQTVIDARAAPRYRGEVEPLDPVAGHIPGALNRPFTDNFAADGRFKSAAVLRAEFDALLAGRDPAAVVHHCGSGVTALPNMLAMELAGFEKTTLFAGSWSEWCSNKTRPVERA